MECWKNVEGFNGYQISNYGRVRSFMNNRHGQCALKGRISQTGGWKFEYMKDGDADDRD